FSIVVIIAPPHAFCVRLRSSSCTRKACGGAIITTIENLDDKVQQVFGTCELFEETQIGSERYNFFYRLSKS
ncbi:unnamed protein product, partial [Adineta steineri]